MTESATLDQYPASVVVADRTFRHARVYVAKSGRAGIFVKRGGRGVLELSGRVAVYSEPGEGSPISILLSDGTKWHVTAKKGCPCHDPLKRINPAAMLAAS